MTRVPSMSAALAGIIHNAVSIDPAEADFFIDRYPAWQCQDWSCPSAMHCGRHFGLSKRYAAMAEMGTADALIIPPRSGAECEHYLTASIDHFAASLSAMPVSPICLWQPSHSDGSGVATVAGVHSPSRVRRP